MNRKDKFYALLMFMGAGAQARFLAGRTVNDHTSRIIFILSVYAVQELDRMMVEK